MINRLHGWLNKPENGWDPVSAEYAREYGSHEWSVGPQRQLIEDLKIRLGGFHGRQVLDLGGGPGQYAVEFARRGADVTWLDVSRNYRDFAQQKAREAGVHLEFFLGYMDDAHGILRRQFDLVFNRICWYYCLDDRSFAGVVYRLVRPGGWAYIDTNHSGVGRESAGMAARVRAWLNDRMGFKVGHPFPPRGRVASLFLGFPLREIHAEFAPRNDKVLFQRDESSK